MARAPAVEFTDAEVAAVVARFQRRRGRFGLPRVLAIAVAGAVLAAAAALSVPAGRAALDDAIERFFAGGEPPGQPASSVELPRWLRELENETGTRAHVLVRSGDEELLAYRPKGGGVCFDFDDRVGVCIPPEEEGGGADSFFGGEPVMLWGPTHRDAAGRWVLWAIAVDAVASVELRYADGSSTAAGGRNGFIVRAEQGRAPVELVAFDAGGRELTRIDVRRRFALAPVGG